MYNITCSRLIQNTKQAGKYMKEGVCVLDLVQHGCEKLCVFLQTHPPSFTTPLPLPPAAPPHFLLGVTDERPLRMYCDTRLNVQHEEGVKQTLFTVLTTCR